MKCSDHSAYRRAYCGLCKGLGKQFGTASRVLVNHDVVLFATIVDGVMEQGGEQGSCRCPIAPWQHRSTLEPSSAAMQSATGVQMLLADQWLADKSIDGNPGARLLRPALSRNVRRARKLLEDLGIDPSAFDDLEQRQLKVEQRAQVGPKEAAENTANLMGLIFRQIANLEEASPAMKQHRVRLQLEMLGRALGTAIYLIDALEDLDKDLRRGHFNPCLSIVDGTAFVSSDRLKACAALLEDSLAQIATAVCEIPWERHGNLVRHILCKKFPETSARAWKGVGHYVPGTAALVLPAPWMLMSDNGGFSEQEEYEDQGTSKMDCGSCGDCCCNCGPSHHSDSSGCCGCGDTGSGSTSGGGDCGCGACGGCGDVGCGGIGDCCGCCDCSC